MATVMIGVDPHKGSHTAVAIDAAEAPLGELRVRASAAQAGKLLEWAAGWPERTWAVEGAGGLGHLLAQQLLAAGEQVVDVQPKLGARVRLLSTGTSNKNDPNDARSVAVAALRSPVRHRARADDHGAVLRVWSRRHRQLSSLRTQAACRLHAVLCELTPGGVPQVITANRAAAILHAHQPDSPAAQAWHDLAEEHLADLRRLDAQLRDTRAKITAAVRASGTSLTQVFGVGPVIAAHRASATSPTSPGSPAADRFASYNGTAPIEVSSGEPEDLPAVHARQPAPQPRHPHGRRHPDRRISTVKATPTTSANSPKARRPPKPAERSSARSATSSTPGCKQTPEHGRRAREGNRGTALNPARPACTPHASSSDKPLPSPPTAYARPATPGP